jgi:hypothetical protein
MKIAIQRCAVGIMTCLLYVSSSSTGRAETQHSITKDVGDSRVTIQETGTENRPTFTVHVQRANSNADFSFGRIAELDTLAVFAYQTTRLIFVGNHQIFLFDPNTDVEIDSFMAFDAAVSPDGRFIAMERMIPLHGDGLSDAVYLLYDVSKSPVLNRLGNTDVIDAGTPIYPEENRSAGRYYLNGMTDATAHTKLSPLVWVGPRLLAFVDNLNATTKALLVDVSQSAVVPDIQQVALDPAEILHLQRLPGTVTTPATLLRIEGIERLASSPSGVALRLTLRPAPWLRTRTTEVRFD